MIPKASLKIQHRWQRNHSLISSHLRHHIPSLEQHTSPKRLDTTRHRERRHSLAPRPRQVHRPRHTAWLQRASPVHQGQHPDPRPRPRRRPLQHLHPPRRRPRHGRQGPLGRETGLPGSMQRRRDPARGRNRPEDRPPTRRIRTAKSRRLPPLRPRVQNRPLDRPPEQRVLHPPRRNGGRLHDRVPRPHPRHQNHPLLPKHEHGRR